MLKKDHRRHIADQFNFHPKENIVVLIQIYFKEKSQHFISDYKMMSYRYMKLLSITEHCFERDLCKPFRYTHDWIIDDF